MSLFLPEDLIHNILLRLPVKSLLVCTSVCKAWNSLIKSPSFLSSHLSRRRRLYLLQLGSCSPVTPDYSFSLRSDDEKLSEYSSIHFPYKCKHEKDGQGFQVISSCNGLVLFKTESPVGLHSLLNLILWNPLLRKSLVIVKSKIVKRLEAAGLVLDSTTGDYKVLTVISENWRGHEELKVELYSLKTNSWKRLHFDFESMPTLWFPTCYREMIFQNGAFHLIAFVKSTRRPVIVGFDVDPAETTLRKIELPECMSRCSSWELSLIRASSGEEALSVLWEKDRVLEWQIWAMDKYGVTESWTLLSTVSCDEVDASTFRCRGLVYRNGGVLCNAFLGANASVPSMMVSHDLESQETSFSYFDNGKSSCCIFLGNYVESLILLDKGDDLVSCNSNNAAEVIPYKMINGMIILVTCLLVLIQSFATTETLLLVNSLVFIFRNTLKNIYQSKISVFATHQFNVGDRCEIDGVEMEVEERNILNTVFVTCDDEKRKVTYENRVLASRGVIRDA